MNKFKTIDAHNLQSQKEDIYSKLKQAGCRITKQRRVLIDILISGKYNSPKEIYYEAVKRDSTIGAATVYRMINTLEEMGVLLRGHMYELKRDQNSTENAMVVELDDNSVIKLSHRKLNHVITSGLKACGYIRDQNMRDYEIIKDI